MWPQQEDVRVLWLLRTGHGRIVLLSCASLAARFGNWFSLSLNPDYDHVVLWVSYVNPPCLSPLCLSWCYLQSPSEIHHVLPTWTDLCSSVSGLQCVAVCCSILCVLHRVAVCCSVLQSAVVRCSVCRSILRALQCVAVCFSMLKCIAVRHSVLQCVAVCCSVLQYVAEPE